MEVTAIGIGSNTHQAAHQTTTAPVTTTDWVCPAEASSGAKSDANNGPEQRNSTRRNDVGLQKSTLGTGSARKAYPNQLACGNRASRTAWWDR
jgi:hypothetical protein